jgi:hypothetical protein
MAWDRWVGLGIVLFGSHFGMYLIGKLRMLEHILIRGGAKEFLEEERKSYASLKR